jgi:hydroxylamine reductase (hybrid-cluster protein)
MGISFARKHLPIDLNQQAEVSLLFDLIISLSIHLLLVPFQSFTTDIMKILSSRFNAEAYT